MELHEQPITDRPAASIPGALVALGVLAGLVLAAALLVAGGDDGGAPTVLGVVLGTAMLLVLPGFFVLQPNKSRVVIVLGRYRGTEKRPGFWWVNPLSAFGSTTVSLRVRNFSSTRSKVNDGNGNPIELAAVVVWQVIDSARASFEVDDYEHFVEIQSETAVRALAQQYPYEDHGGAGLSLSGDSAEVSHSLHNALQERLSAAGVEVIEARLTDLAYATEIAEAMLRRQQAEAIVAAREKIVEGAVGMVESALESLRRSGVVELDEERRASMVSNLMTVLCSDHPTSPVVNVGTLY